MNLFTKSKLKKLQVIGLLAGTVLGISSMLLAPRADAAVTFSGPFNCDANAVLWCGAKNTSAADTDYTKGDGHNSAASIQHIYSFFNISSSDINSLGTTAEAGTVTKSGDVFVGKQLVATNALTAGRQNISGSTKVTFQGTTFYTRKPSVSFENNSLTAYVVMQDGQFKFAILSSCGNPVKAVPKKPTQGVLACSTLLSTPGAIETNGNQSFTFTANATATNASISKYVFNFGGNGTQTINTNALSATSNTQVFAPGSHSVSVTVSGTANNSLTTAPKSVTCDTKFTVAQNGMLTCNSLTLTPISTSGTTGDATYTLTAQASANDATIQKYVFSFGDAANTTQTVTTGATKVTSQEFVYNAGQTFSSIFVTVFGTSKNGNAVTAGGANSACATNLTVPPQTCETGSTAASCKPTCTAPNGQTFPAGSKECTPTTVVTTSSTTPPATLVNTGAGDTIGLFAATTIAGYFGYRLFLNRRAVRQ